MKTARLLCLSLLVTGCASTTSPAPQVLRAYESAPPASIEPEAPPEPQPFGSSDAPVFRLTPPPPGAAPAKPAQDAPAAAVPANRHSFGGGVGIRFRDGDSALDLLVQYKYWVNPKLDVGAIGDWALSPIDTLLIAPAAWWHPHDRLTLVGAPGLEFESGDGAEFAVRLGASYRLMLEKWAIRPFFWYDLVANRNDSLAFGVSFGV